MNGLSYVNFVWYTYWPAVLWWKAKACKNTWERDKRFRVDLPINMSQCNYDNETITAERSGLFSIEYRHSHACRQIFDPEVEISFSSAAQSINCKTSRRGIRSALFRPLDIITQVWKCDVQTDGCKRTSSSDFFYSFLCAVSFGTTLRPGW